MVAHFPSCRRLAQATGLWAIILSQCSGPDSAMAHVGSANAAFVGPHMAAGLGSSFPPAGEPSPRVRSLHRFAVKGLGGDCLNSVVLGRGETFPHDREWALLKAENGDKFDAQAPKWLHKENFECAFTAGEALLQLDTTFDDESCTLSLAQKMPPRRASRTNMLVAEEVLALESFLQEHVLGGRGVKVVRGGGEKRAHVHQFGNTRSGVRHNNDTRTVHIVNADTVAEVAVTVACFSLHLQARARVIWEDVNNTFTCACLSCRSDPGFSRAGHGAGPSAIPREHSRGGAAGLGRVRLGDPGASDSDRDCLAGCHLPDGPVRRCKRGSRNRQAGL